MSNGAKQRYSDLIRKGVESTGRDDPDARGAVYDKLRTANEAMLAKKRDIYTASQSADIRRSLEEAIADHEKAFSPAMFDAAEEEPPVFQTAAQPAAAERPNPRRASSRSQLAIGALAGIVIATLLGWLMATMGLLGSSVDPAQAARSEIVERGLAAADAPLRDAVAFLDQVRDEVVKRQKQDPAALEKLAGTKYIGLAAFDPELQKALPKTLPKGSAMLLRANKSSYKILLNWPLCPAVKFLRPDLVDPVRDLPGLSCAMFGVWNAPGAKL